MWSSRKLPMTRKMQSFCPRLEALEDRWLPSTLTVTNNLNSGAGSLRYEIGEAHKGDTIVFAPSLDGQTIFSGDLDITKSMTIQGPGAGQLTINGGGGFGGVRVFKVEKNTNVTLSGLTITGGTGIADPGYISAYDGKGGGILNLGTLTVSGCTVSGNYASNVYNSDYGGGIYNAGTLTVSNSTVFGNFASPFNTDGYNYVDYGGGIYNAGTLSVSGCTISDNYASGGEGGGIYNAGTATVISSTLSGNSNVYLGGGIYNAGTLTISDSIFSSNFPDNIYGSYTDGGGNTFN